MSKIAFGGGCHWCTEAIFEHIRGVRYVEQGWISATHPEANTPSEAVIVHFDRSCISPEVLIEIHLFTHHATSNHTLRSKYRSAIYTFCDTQEEEARTILLKKQRLFEKPLVTKVYPFGTFRLNKARYLHYYKRHRNKPFCQIRIEPKLKILLSKFGEYAHSSPPPQ